MIKRFLDLVLCTIVLTVLAPVLSLAILWIKLDSSGPAIFRQKRVGWRGREFTILKLRTMRVAKPIGDPGPSITVGDDARVTRAGRFLRKWKLDELPQLLNVLKGEMSLVGPRPEVPRYVAMYPDELREIIQSVRPGLTDLASIAYRNESEILAQVEDPESYYRDVVMPAKLKLCAKYVANRSIWLDLRILWQTFVAVGRGNTAIN